ncbi:MAG TPA: Rieske 2Fe-2S domain-containing protein [Thermoanaerobaculia bacterium]|nr:Rieske 2Fe-2S domain-containing protein [Thermoanaerobaculia bacterium]
MNAQDNDLLTRVGPGTPMGSLLRCYWLPVMESTELGPPDGPPQRVRLLGERLVAFRDTSGRPGLVAESCPHRGASLFFGRNEEGGLRCVYHGWKFGADGDCLDLPTEPADSRLRRGVRQAAYRCVERQGILWAYLGSRAEPPALPALGWSLVPPSQRGALKYRRDCNWLQALEGDIDTAHLGWLHARFAPGGGREVAFGAHDSLRDIAARDTRPVLEVVDTAAGVVIGARRAHEDSQHYWRITQFLMPIFTSVPAIGPQNRAKAWVPLDDWHTLVWEPHWHPTEALGEEDRRGWKGRVPASGMLPDDGSGVGRGRFAANRENDYLIDRERQRSGNFSGIEESPPLQDGAIQESMGAIVDRAREHLGASDEGILRVRRRLLEAALRLRDCGEEPPGLRDPDAYARRGCQLLLPHGADWLEASREAQRS